ncbi:unnamed protein product, partial [Phaeothamnion confervicola]
QRRDRLLLRVQETKSRLAAVESQISQQEASLKTADAQLKQQRAKLYAGGITNSKELNSLEEETAKAQAQRDALEEAILDAMQSQEQLAKNLHTTDLEEAEADLKEAQEDEEERLLLIGQREIELQRARSATAANIPANELQAYERLNAAHGSPLAKVKGGTCLGCHMDLPSSHWRGVRQGQLLTCPSCARYLYE